MNRECDNNIRPEPSDPLDALLLEEAGHIDDAGFTVRVMQALPARRPGRSIRSLVLTVAFALGCLIGIWALPPLPVLIDLTRFGWQNPQLGLLIVFIPVLAAVSALGWTLYTLTAEEA